MFSRGVIDAKQLDELRRCSEKEQIKRLFRFLETSKHPQPYVEFREGLRDIDKELFDTLDDLDVSPMPGGESAPSG